MASHSDNTNPFRSAEGDRRSRSRTPPAGPERSHQARDAWFIAAYRSNEAIIRGERPLQPQANPTGLDETPPGYGSTDAQTGSDIASQNSENLRLRLLHFSDREGTPAQQAEQNKAREQIANHAMNIYEHIRKEFYAIKENYVRNGKKLTPGLGERAQGLVKTLNNVNTMVKPFLETAVAQGSLPDNIRTQLSHDVRTGIETVQHLEIGLLHGSRQSEDSQPSSPEGPADVLASSQEAIWHNRSHVRNQFLEPTLKRAVQRAVEVTETRLNTAIRNEMPNIDRYEQLRQDIYTLKQFVIHDIGGNSKIKEAITRLGIHNEEDTRHSNKAMGIISGAAENISLEDFL